MRVHAGLLRLSLATTALVLLAGAVPAAAQQTGVVTGVVVESGNNQPLTGAQVFVPGTQFGGLTDARGRFTLRLPPGAHNVRVELIGYIAQNRPVTVAAGRSSAINFVLDLTALRMSELVVTGVATATPKTKLPFSIAKVNVEAVPVTARSAESAIQGKVAGARIVQGSGKPGDPATVMLRGPTSINSEGRSLQPLYIVDDVIVQGDLADIDPQDIANIEVVKGAAAASMYGSRAANGVIRVTTKRGQAIQEDMSRYTLRTEYGNSELTGDIPLSTNHPYRMNAGQTKFISNTGKECEFKEFAKAGCASFVLQGGTPGKTFQDQPYPGPLFNQIERFFDPSDRLQNYIGVEGRRGSTNYFASFTNLDEQGVILGHEGYQRRTFRLNLDHGLREDIQLSLSSFYSISDQDELSTGPFFGLTFMPPNIDLLEKSEDGELIPKIDPTSLETNPLYEVFNRDVRDKQQRFMGSGIARYAPVSWFDFEANASYDRTDFNRSDIFKKGYKTVQPSNVNKGQIDKQNSFEDAFNGSVTASLYGSFLDGTLKTRTRARYLYERDHESFFRALGQNLAVQGVPDLDVVQGTNKTVGSEVTDVRAEGYFLINAFEFRDRYIADFLVRRDGSSLFGDNERWQTYYRGSFAWRLSQEPWWFGGQALNEAKLRFSYGTAGGRPNFYAQYESYAVTGGQVRPAQLGNRDLAPEFATEMEAGIDLGLWDRASFTVTYANSVVEDQILRIPLPAYAGFESQWRNAGTLESNTWEATLETALFQREKVSWTGRLLFDRTRQEITQLDVPPYQWGYGNAFYNRPGEVLGTFYGHRWATSCSDMLSGAQRTRCQAGEFQVNDDGYLVYVGAGNTWQEGVSKNMWGTPATTIAGTTVQGTTVNQQFLWGMPFYARNDSANIFLPMGNTMPDFNFGVSSNVDYHGLSLYALFDASMGFDIYNQTRQWAYRDWRSGEVDQAGKSNETKKPVQYYSILYDVNDINSHFVEDGSFVKLRELSLRYSFGKDLLSRARLGGFERATFSLIGRNLKTWTDYKGYDPEVGLDGGRVTGCNATLCRFDAYNYPNFRTMTVGVELVF